MIKEIAEFEVDFGNDKMEIDESIYIPEDLTKFLVVE